MGIILVVTHREGLTEGSRVIECLTGTYPDSDSLGNKNRYRIGREDIGIGTGIRYRVYRIRSSPLTHDHDEATVPHLYIYSK